MTASDLEQIRPWLDPEQRPTDAGYPAPYRLVNRGWRVLENGTILRVFSYLKDARIYCDKRAR